MRKQRREADEVGTCEEHAVSTAWLLLSSRKLVAHVAISVCAVAPHAVHADADGVHGNCPDEQHVARKVSMAGAGQGALLLVAGIWSSIVEPQLPSIVV